MMSFLFFFREMNKINKFVEESREKFTQLDLHDVDLREKLKHAKSKVKKLQKQLQKDNEKVVCSFLKPALVFWIYPFT